MSGTASRLGSGRRNKRRRSNMKRRKSRWWRKRRRKSNRRYIIRKKEERGERRGSEKRKWRGEKRTEFVTTRLAHSYRHTDLPVFSYCAYNLTANMRALSFFTLGTFHER